MIFNNDSGIRRFTVWMAVALVVVIADQVTKLAIIEHIEEFAKVPLTAFLNLTHQKNFGAAFSFLADASGWQRWFFVVLATVVSAVIAVWMWRIRGEGPIVLTAGLSLVLGGAVGNVIDRIRLGYVTDFIQVNLPIPFFDPFPSFNVADSAITVGAVLLIVDSLFFSGKDDKKL
ncbi:MAG: signal peptidase II [Gammaproteobacteria bacterium]|nr:signal peptidase II [Gammaproteobacteria bacterium]